MQGTGRALEAIVQSRTVSEMLSCPSFTFLPIIFTSRLIFLGDDVPPVSLVDPAIVAVAAPSTHSHMLVFVLHYLCQSFSILTAERLLLLRLTCSFFFPSATHHHQKKFQTRRSARH